MTSFVKLKKILGFLLFLLLFFFSVVVPARAENRLTEIRKQEDPNRTRLIFDLSSRTPFSVDHSGQRVDLVLETTTPADSLRNLPEDGTIVRMTLIRRQQDLIVSLLLRRPPVLVVAEEQNNPARIILDLDWRGDEGARPGIAFRIGDMPPRITGAAGTRFQQQSPWEGHWQVFFREYRTPWRLSLPPSATPLPPLEWIMDPGSPLWPLQQFADDRTYLSLLKEAFSLGTLSGEERYLRDLMMADAYLRTGSYAAGLARLRPFQGQESEYAQRVDFLTVWGELSRGNAIEALLYLNVRLSDLRLDDPLAAEMRLLHAEAALATSQYQSALGLLAEDDMNWPARLVPIRQLRLADALLGLKDRDAALERFRSLAERIDFCGLYQSSCGLAATAAFQAGDYGFARQLFERLSLEMTKQPSAHLIHFAAAASAYEAGEADLSWIALEQVGIDYPNSEGGDRAQLRLLDIRIVNGGKESMNDAIPGYVRLGRESAYRPIREEASFKEALSLFLLERHHDSVVRLMDFRRNFRTSPLHREANILLARQLPVVVEELLAQDRDLQAVVLVEQNRDLLLASGYDRAFLNNLAVAFDRLGLYDRAARVLLYLFDHSTQPEVRRDIYLPLAKTYVKRQQHAVAGDYARQYLEQYPHGPDAGDLFVMLMDAFAEQQQEAEILSWVQRPDRPDSPLVDIRAAQFYWQRDDFSAVTYHLDRAARRTSLPVKELALLAEAHYRLGNFSASRSHYEALVDDPQLGSQARYRYAQILLQTGARPAAVNQLRQLVSVDTVSAWGKLAQDLLSHLTRGTN